MSLIIGFFECRKIIFCRPARLNIVFPEIKRNIGSGIKLLIANFSSILTNGIVKIGIQDKWDVATYGKISLSMSLTNVFLTVINAISLVLYPFLKQTDKEKFPQIYINCWNLVFYFIALCLMFYYPLILILSIWIPQYIDSLRYLGIILPICLFTIKASLLTNNLLKVVRKEKTIMFINLLSIFFAFITTIISVYLFQSIVLAVFAILFNTMVKCIVSDLYLSKKLEINNFINVIEEILITFIFVLTNWFIGGLVGFVIYMVYIIIHFLIMKNKFFNSLKYVKNFYGNRKEII